MRTLPRPGSVPIAGRRGKGHLRPSSGAVGRRRGNSAPVDCSRRLDLSVTGSAPSLPIAGAVTMPELRVLSTAAVASPLAERSKSSKMVGTLTSTFTGPLQDCTSFRRLRDATAHMSGRTHTSPVSQSCNVQARHHGDPSIMEIPAFGEPQSPENTRPSASELLSPSSGNAVSSTATGGEAAVRQALIVAATRQCCRLLRRGWETVEAASQTVPILVGLREDGLLSPLLNVQMAALEALLGLLNSNRRPKTSGGPPAPGSFAAWTGPEQAQGEAQTSPNRPPSAIQLDVHQWSQQAQVFARLAEAALLPTEGSERAGHLLEAELRRCLKAPTPQDLRRVAQRLAEGGAWIARALAALSSSTTDRDESQDLCQQSGDEVAPESIRALIATAMRTATATDMDRDSPAAVAAREALQRVGLLDINEEFPDCAGMASREPRRSRSAPGFGRALPDLMRDAPRKRKQPPSVLESGMWQLEAAKAILRENRLPHSSVQPKSFLGRR